MHLDDFKRWHWMVISIVVGLAMAYVYAGSVAEGGPSNRRTIGVSEFLNKVGRTTADMNRNQIPLLRNVTIYPPIENKNVVTCEELVVTNNKEGKGEGEYQQRQMVAEIPFALNRQKPPSATWTIQDELLRRQKNNSRVQFHYAAMAATPYVYGICIGGSFLVIGVLWPTLLSYLKTAGYAGPPRPVEDRIDLSKVRSGTGKSQPPPKKLGPTQAQMDQLDAVTANYEQKVGHAMASMNSANDGKSTAATASNAPARRWENMPTEEAKPAGPPVEEDDIEIKGEYYPVMIHHKKPHEEKKD